MSNAKVVATITENGIDVELQNWDGVSNVMVERIHYAIIKKSQVYRAQKLGTLHAANMLAEANRAKEVKPVSNFIKDIENAITS